MSIHTDYDREVDFSRLKTYRWIEEPVRAPSAALQNSPLLERRVRDAVDRELAARGYIHPLTGPVDFFVAFHAGLRDRIDITQTAYHGRRPGFRREVAVDRYHEGTLVIDVIRPGETPGVENARLVWRGWARGAVGDRDQAASQVNDAVAGILSRFPPQP
jgi:hypothetical protein